MRRAVRRAVTESAFALALGRKPNPETMLPAFICNLIPDEQIGPDWWKADPEQHYVIWLGIDFSDPREADIAKLMTDALQRAQEHQETCLKCRGMTFVAHRFSEPDWDWLSTHHPGVAGAAMNAAIVGYALGVVPGIYFS